MVHLVRGVLELLMLHILQLLVMGDLLWCTTLLLLLLLSGEVKMLSLMIRQRLLSSLLHRLCLRLGLHQLVMLSVLSLLLLGRHRWTGRCWTWRLRWRMDKLLLLRRHCSDDLIRWLLRLTRSTGMTKTYRARTSRWRTVHWRTHRLLVWRRHYTRWDLLHHVR